MKDFEIIQGLVGEDVTEADLSAVDCYVRPELGIFIPAAGPCGFAAKENHAHPSYMAVVYFDEKGTNPALYPAEITSPGVPHNDAQGRHYYCVLIEKEHFERRYRMYSGDLPVFREQSFGLCGDILKALNTFAFEYGKSMPNADITLQAQAEIITHWLIRSILGETLDVRAVSDDYSVARAQHFMERRYEESITVPQLAALGHVSPSCFVKRFKKELGTTPFDYLIEVRMDRAKTMLRRKTASITEIALRCGFNGSSHFATAFLKRFGVTPRAYRAQYKE